MFVTIEYVAGRCKKLPSASILILEFNKKLKQIKNSLLSKCVLDVREYLENTHSPMVAAYLHPEVTQPQEPQRGDLPPPVVGNLRTP